MKQSFLNSPRLSQLYKKKQKKVKKKVIIFLIIFFVLILSISFALRIPAFNINNLIISGNKVIETKVIEDIVKNEISGHYLWLFPKTNFLIYPKYKIKKELNSKFKRFENLSIKVKDFKSLEVNVSEYEGKYLWCGVVVPILNSNINQKCYFLDDSGYIFDEAPYFSGNVFFKFYGDDIVNKENPLGSYFIKDKFVKIIEFKNTIEKMNLKPNALWLDNDREANFSLSNEPMIGPRIIFKIDEDYQKLAENLQAAISTEPLQTELKTKLSSLLYIDLRFGNKVYYKFQ